MGSRYNEKTYKANVKYRAENIKRVPLDIQLAEYERIKAHAQSNGETVNGFIKRAIRLLLSDELNNGSQTE